MKTRKGYKAYPLTAAQKFHNFYAPYSPGKEILNVGTSLTIEFELNLDELLTSVFISQILLDLLDIGTHLCRIWNILKVRITVQFNNVFHKSDQGLRIEEPVVAHDKHAFKTIRHLNDDDFIHRHIFFLRAAPTVSDSMEAAIDVFHLEEEPTKRLMTFCEQQHISLQCLLLMGIRTYLQKVNQCDDVSIQVAYARRATLQEKKSGGTRIHSFPFALRFGFPVAALASSSFFLPSKPL